MIKWKTNNKNKKAIRYFILTLALVFTCSIFSLTAFAIGAEEKTASEQVTKQPDTNVVIGTNSGESKGTGTGSTSAPGTVTTPSKNTNTNTNTNSGTGSKSSVSSKTSSTPASSKPASSKASSKSLPSWDNDDDSVDGTLSDVDLGDALPLDSSSDGVSSSAAVVKPAEVEGIFSPMLVGGIALVILGLAGIGFFIYLQCFSKGNTMADITQQAKRDAKRYQRRK